MRRSDPCFEGVVLDQEQLRPAEERGERRKLVLDGARFDDRAPAEIVEDVLLGRDEEDVLSAGSGAVEGMVQAAGERLGQVPRSSDRLRPGDQLPGTQA